MPRTESCERILGLAQHVDASSTVTASAIYWVERIARQTAWDRWHLQPCRNRESFSVTEDTIIRGRKVQLKLFISVHGATYCRRWKVDGHPWKREEVYQTFGR